MVSSSVSLRPNTSLNLLESKACVLVPQVGLQREMEVFGYMECILLVLPQVSSNDCSRCSELKGSTLISPSVGALLNFISALFVTTCCCLNLS